MVFNKIQPSYHYIWPHVIVSIYFSITNAEFPFFFAIFFKALLSFCIFIYVIFFDCKPLIKNEVNFCGSSSKLTINSTTVISLVTLILFVSDLPASLLLAEPD